MDKERIYECIGCVNLRFNKEEFRFYCAEAQGSKYDKNNCPYFDDGIKDFYRTHIFKDMDLKGVDDLDFYQLAKPVADMVLWNWGLKLVGGGDEYNLVVINEDWFRGRLIKELLKTDDLK